MPHWTPAFAGVTVDRGAYCIFRKIMPVRGIDRRATSEHATKQMGCAVTFAELP